MEQTLRCDRCGNDFRQARHWQRFCSTKCRDAWHRHNYKLEEVKDAEAVRDAKKQLRTQIDGHALVEALKYRRAVAVVAENGGLRRRAL